MNEAETIVLLGLTGSGKATLANLLLSVAQNEAATEQPFAVSADERTNFEKVMEAHES